MVTAKVRYDESRYEWIALIMRSNTVLDVGCERDRRAITRWVESALQAYTADPDKAHHIPDMYDRAHKN